MKHPRTQLTEDLKQHLTELLPEVNVLTWHERDAIQIEDPTLVIYVQSERFDRAPGNDKTRPLVRTASVEIVLGVSRPGDESGAVRQTEDLARKIELSMLELSDPAASLDVEIISSDMKIEDADAPVVMLSMLFEITHIDNLAR